MYLSDGHISVDIESETWVIGVAEENGPPGSYYAFFDITASSEDMARFKALSEASKLFPRDAGKLEVFYMVKASEIEYA